MFPQGFQGYLLILVLTLNAATPGLAKPSGGSPSENHWAFKPIADPMLKEVTARGSKIDGLIRRELLRQGLDPSERANPRALFRRLHYDLVGLPPNYADSEAFAARATGELGYRRAIEQAVDRLLSSPRFGEKWARHWLDVARYADTKGYVFTEERRFPFSFTYRDWVINAFNADLPYDEFVVAQLAADHLGQQRRADLAAMGFLTLGRRFLNKETDIIDDRIDVVTRGMLGLTVSCARCHDHKFDPIPIEDYYSLYGVFQSSTEPKELPVLGDPKESEAYREFKRRLATLEAAVVAFKKERHSELLTASVVAEYLNASWAAKDLDKRATRRLALDRKLYPAVLQRWKDLLFESESLEMALWKEVADLGTDERVALLQSRIEKASEPAAHVGKQLLQIPLDESFDVHAAVAKILVEAMDGREEAKEAAVFLTGEGGIADLSPDALVRDYQVKDRNQVRKLQRRVARFKATSEGAPKRAMALIDRSRPVDPVVFERGNPARRGAPVPRQFLVALSNGERKPFQHGSGRLELARAIADRSNPLTARVVSNRIWMHLMGAPLVESPSDFGVRTPRPAIPGLLDHLAWYLMENGWSVKQLIRHIVLSEAYQQSSDGGEDVVKKDPENRLFARAERKRLPFEGLRDAMLFASESLDARMFGRSVDLRSEPFSLRRTVYGFIDRQNLPGMFRTFDFASPDAHCPERHETTVPQQALFLMNNAFSARMADALAASVEVVMADTDDRRVVAIYRLALSRNPSAAELRLGVRFLRETAGSDGADLRMATASFAQAILSSNEFVFID